MTPTDSTGIAWLSRILRTAVIAAFAVALASSVAGGCGGNTDSDAIVNEADAGEEASDSATAQCFHLQRCGDRSEGDTCSNACGFPCKCLLDGPGGYLTWRCEVPVVGERCDPAVNGSCSYIPSGNWDGIGCDCVAPLGEYYWNCSGGGGGLGDGLHSVCPKTIQDGASCSDFPAGLTCGYTPDGGSTTYGCECTREHVWACN